jgi:outer membrane lipoprotein-sorting protein
MRTWCLVAGAAIALGAASGSGGEAETDSAIACAQANLPRHTSVQTVDLVSRDRLGSERHSKAKIYWKRFEDGLSRVLVFVSEPTNVRGTALLILETGGDPSIFSYLPELRKVRRIHARSVSGSFLGSDFSYEDIERLQGLAEDADLRRLEDTTIAGRPVYVLEGRPKRAGSSYARIVSYVDRETCVPLRTDAYDESDGLVRRFETSPERVVRRGDAWVPLEISATSPDASTRSELRIDAIELDVELPDRLFSEHSLERPPR